MDKWRKEDNHKPILLRGARQAGKSSTVRNFAKKFDFFLEINFEEDKVTRLFYWQREEKNANAEIDFVVQQGMEIVPIEVKSGKQGKMQSMHLFLNEKKSKIGIRTSLENFSVYNKIKVVPLYAIGNFSSGKLIE